MVPATRLPIALGFALGAATAIRTDSASGRACLAGMPQESPAARTAQENRAHAGAAGPSRAQRSRIEWRASRVRMPLELDAGQPIVQLMLNGGGPYRFGVDTAAGTTVTKGAEATKQVLRGPICAPDRQCAPGRVVVEGDAIICVAADCAVQWRGHFRGQGGFLQVCGRRRPGLRKLG